MPPMTVEVDLVGAEYQVSFTVLQWGDGDPSVDGDMFTVPIGSADAQSDIDYAMGVVIAITDVIDEWLATGGFSE
jgi:hypothetical protein